MKRFMIACLSAVFLTGPAAATDFRLQVVSTSGSNSEDFFFDNVAVSAVPEPASLVLLVLGVLAAMWRWRERARAAR